MTHFDFWVPFGVLFIGFLWPLILLRKTFCLGDYEVQHLPWALHLAEAVQAGRLPLWTDLMAGGFPLMAEGQVGAYYLLNLAAYRLLPFLAAWTWSIPLHMLLGACGMYLYARRLGLSQPAASLAAMVFAFGSGFGGLFYNTGSLRVLTWLPWVLWLLEDARWAKKRKRLVSYGILAVLFSQQWAGGFSQLAVYAFGYCALHEIWAVFAQAPAHIKPKGKGDPLLFLFGALTLGTLFVLPQVIATSELIGRSVREGETLAFALWGSVHPAGAVSLLFPKWGNTMRISFYVGVPALVFAASLLALRPRREHARHLFLAAFFFLLAWGKYNPVYSWLLDAFDLTMIRNPFKFLFFTVFSLGILGGMGYDRFLAAVKKGESLAVWRRTVLGVLWAAAAAPLAVTFVLEQGGALWRKLGDRYVLSVIAEKAHTAKDASYYFETFNTFYRSLEEVVSPRDRFNLNAVVLVLVVVLAMLFYARREITQKNFKRIVLAAAVTDLCIFASFLGTGFMGNAGPMPALSGAEGPELVPPPGVRAARFHLEGTHDTAVEFAPGGPEIIPPNKGMMYGLPHAGGYSPLLLKPYYELAYPFGIADGSLGRVEFSAAVWSARRRLLDILGAGVILSSEPLDWEALESAASEGGRLIYVNKRTLPKAAGFYGWKAIPKAEERLAFMNGDEFDPHRTLVIEQAPRRGESSGEPLEPGAVTLDDPRDLHAVITMKRDGLGFIRKSAYPGWRLWVDGKERPWFPADHAFVGFELAAGAHKVRFRYDPAWLVPSTVLAALGWLGTAVFLARAAFFSRKRPRISL